MKTQLLMANAIWLGIRTGCDDQGGVWFYSGDVVVVTYKKRRKSK